MSFRTALTAEGVRPGIGNPLRALRFVGVLIPGTEEFWATLAAMGEAVHNFDVDPAQATRIVEAGNAYLANINALIVR